MADQNERTQVTKICDLKVHLHPVSKDLVLVGTKENWTFAILRNRETGESGYSLYMAPRK